MQRTMEPERERPHMPVSAAYLVFQGVAGAVWWACLVWMPASRDYFMPPGAPDWAILAFWLADGLLFAVGSVLTGVLLFRDGPLVRPVLWFTAGAVSYASLYCLGLSILTGSVWLAAGAMMAAMCVTLGISIRYERRCRP